MRKLIEELHVIKDECAKHEKVGVYCKECPMYSEESEQCLVTSEYPSFWSINDNVGKALL